MGNFYQDVIETDARFKSALPCRDVWLLEPGTRAAVAAIIADAALQGITLEVTETFRSATRQQQLFAQGKTELDGRSPATIGTHHFGIAADFMRVEGGKSDWTAKDYYFLGPLAEKHGMVWGGNWGDPADLPDDPGFHDWVHLQRCGIEEQDALFTGTFYPNGSTDDVDLARAADDGMPHPPEAV
jgi:hypothetical protein